MSTILNTLIAQVLVLSFLGTLIITGLIYLVGRKGSGGFLANASVGVSFTWFCAFILGTPDFPPEFNNTAILSATACLLTSGALFDFILIKRKIFPQPIVMIIFLISGVGITIWMRSGIDFWSLPILLGWSIVAFGLQRLSANEEFGSGDSALMLVIASFGTAIIAWISDIAVDRDLAFGLCAISFGFFICTFPKPRLRFGYSILLAGGGSLYMLALRLVEQMPPLIPAFIVLGFIFFVDVASQYVQINLKLISPIPTSIKLLVLALFPLTLATVVTLVAIEFPIN